MRLSNIFTLSLTVKHTALLQYISGTQLTQDTLSEDNPLFVVNGRWDCEIREYLNILLLIFVSNAILKYRANLNFDPPVRKIKPVIQDAIQIQNTVARQTAW